MTNQEVEKNLKEGNLEALKTEAIKRGYVTGITVNYGSDVKSIFGSGNYDIIPSLYGARLIKYDKGSIGEFDTIFDTCGWVEIVKKNKVEEFEELTKPLIEWLQENHDPHTKILIDYNRAELLEGKMGTKPVLQKDSPTKEESKNEPESKHEYEQFARFHWRKKQVFLLV